jgi:hypothetical protein
MGEKVVGRLSVGAQGVLAVVLGEEGVVLGCANRCEEGGGSEGNSRGVTKPTIADGELGEGVGSRGKDGRIAGVGVVSTLENVEASFLNHGIESVSCRKGERWRCDALIVFKAFVADLAKEPKGGMGVVGSGGERDNGIDTVLETSYFVEGVLGDGSINAEETTSDIDPIKDHGGLCEQG